MPALSNELRCPICGKSYRLASGQREVGCPNCREARAMAQGQDDQRTAEITARSDGAPWVRLP